MFKPRSAFLVLAVTLAVLPASAARGLSQVLIRPAQAAQITQKCGAIAEAVIPAFERNAEEISGAGYLAGYCSQNSKNLFKRLLAHGIQLPHSFVVHVVPLNAQTVKPRKAKGNVREWSFHAFLIVDGLVLDQDFTDHASPIGLTSYLKQMFNAAELAKYGFQFKPADEYGSTNQIYGRMDVTEYPVFTLDQFSKSMSSSTCASM